MTDFGNELRHDGWQYEEPPTAEEQAKIDRAASEAAGLPPRCPGCHVMFVSRDVEPEHLNDCPYQGRNAL